MKSNVNPIVIQFHRLCESSLLKKARAMAVILLLNLLSHSALLAQDITVRGKVTDDAGVAISNASVVVKGTAIGTTTGTDGAFTIVAPRGSKLVISEVNHASQEITVGANANVTVKLVSNEKALAEV